MRPFILVFLGGMVALTGCVTEGPETARGDRDHPTPVEKVQSTVAKQIVRLNYQQGRALLASIQSIIALGDLAREPVLAALPEVNPRTRANLIYVLGHIGGPGVHRKVSEHLKDGDPGVRYESAAALISMGDWSTVPVLMDFMESRDVRLRYKAFQALKEATGQEFGYHFSGPTAEREQALSRWKSWWSTRRQEIIYGKR